MARNGRTRLLAVWKGSSERAIVHSSDLSFDSGDDISRSKWAALSGQNVL